MTGFTGFVYEGGGNSLCHPLRGFRMDPFGIG